MVSASPTERAELYLVENEASRADSSAFRFEGEFLSDSKDQKSRIESGDYIADIMQGSGSEPFWYYILQHNNSNQILDIQKFDTQEQAVQAAHRVLNDVPRRGQAAEPQ